LEFPVGLIGAAKAGKSHTSCFSSWFLPNQQPYVVAHKRPPFVDGGII
jgi:hypothetical protein